MPLASHNRVLCGVLHSRPGSSHLLSSNHDGFHSYAVAHGPTLVSGIAPEETTWPGWCSRTNTTRPAQPARHVLCVSLAVPPFLAHGGVCFGVVGEDGDRILWRRRPQHPQVMAKAFHHHSLIVEGDASRLWLYCLSETGFLTVPFTATMQRLLAAFPARAASHQRGSWWQGACGTVCR